MEYTKHILDNGLTIIVHTDKSSPMVAMNILYNVGARDEDPKLTGFAHLFEHLMFGGSVNIPDFDMPLQMAGGENNAFTNNDYTNYYLTLPAQNLETAFWLESDRMLELAFSEESLAVQKKVVIEEYRQRYLNQPYGDAWLLLRALAYSAHPYRWPTIGMEIRHIEDATLSAVKTFFFSHYAPNNAILTLAGDIEPDQAIQLSEKWFGPIPSRLVPLRNLPGEPKQLSPRYQEKKGNVPGPAVYLAWHMGDRLSRNYYQNDLLSDVLSSGMSARLFLNLVKDKKLFSDIDAYITGDRDPGLFVISGRLADQVDPTEGMKAVGQELLNLIEEPVKPRELEKVLNRMESNLLFNNMNIVNKAMNLGYYQWLGNPARLSQELGIYRSVTAQELQSAAAGLFSEENCSRLVYLSNDGK
ncbi:MAG: peptidase M16 [Bacteroidetes bacterium GWF2_49_14]|nr:MAG: peptidase M16 [Bacteroidetes bacterium GWF2_49_14]HBB91266.1 peptidase M16 [Bacteroidales bacterium]